MRSSPPPVRSSPAARYAAPWVDRFGDDLDAQVHMDEVSYAKAYPVAPLPGWNQYAYEALLAGFLANLSSPEAGDAYLAENVTD